jgi:hypothetical protein
MENLKIEDARIIFRNFAGVETRYNRAGNRNFCVIVDDADIAQQLISDGWNVKTLAPRDEDEEPRYYIPAAVSYKNIPPKIYLICGRSKVLLDEDTVGELDTADIVNVDVILRPYCWDLGNGKSGVKAYVKTMYVTIEKDEFADKYAEEESPEEMPF